MSLRIRIGPLTFGKTGVRLGTWRRRGGISFPLTPAKKASKRTLGGLRFGPFRWFFIIELLHGRILDPAYGSGGMFVRSARFIEEHKQNHGAELSVYGQEKVAETVRLGKTNLAVHGLAGDIRQGNSYYENLHRSTGKVGFMLVNLPYDEIWKKDLEAMGGKDGMCDPRFEVTHAGDELSLVIHSNDGQMLFLAYMQMGVREDQSCNYPGAPLEWPFSP